MFAGVRAHPSIKATREECSRALPGDDRLPVVLAALTHGISIARPPTEVWPWLVQMGAGSRAGWYSYDWIDNGRQPSARKILPELQCPTVGTIFPALPGRDDGFTLLALEPYRFLVLGWLDGSGAAQVTWTFLLTEPRPGVTRLVVRARGGPDYRFRGLPPALTKVAVRMVHFVMQRKQLRGIKDRVETMA
jgi:hypothetical protein